MARMEIIHNWTNGGILGKEDPKKSWETQRKQLPNPTNVLEDLPLPPHCLTNTLSDYWEMSRKESLDNHVASDQNTQESWRTRHYFPSIEDDSFGIICYRKDERWKEREREKKESDRAQSHCYRLGLLLNIECYSTPSTLPFTSSSPSIACDNVTHPPPILFNVTQLFRVVPSEIEYDFIFNINSCLLRGQIIGLSDVLSYYHVLFRH